MTAESGENDHTPSAKEAVAKVKEAVGWATGDRAVEAQGEVEQEEAAVERGEADPGTVEKGEDAEIRVRAEHGDIHTGEGGS